MTLRVTFLGTAGAVPTVQRNPSGIYVNREGDELLFDVGEGTQRQMMRYGTGFGITDIFLTHLHGDHVYGLPGLLDTLAFQGHGSQVVIHTPERTRQSVVELIMACGGEPGFPVRVTEVQPGAVVKRGDEYEVKAFKTDHRSNSVGYALVEDDRKGRFDRPEAERLGVPSGPLFGRLHEGESVVLDDGTEVRPEQVVGPPRPGRHVVYTGDTRPTDRVVEIAAGADLLIHDATFADDQHERAEKTGHSTSRQAAGIAEQAAVSQLALTHISPRYGDDPSQLLESAGEEFDGEVVVAEDGLELDIPFPDADS